MIRDSAWGCDPLYGLQQLALRSKLLIPVGLVCQLYVIVQAAQQQQQHKRVPFQRDLISRPCAWRRDT